MDIKTTNKRLLIHGGWPAHGDITLSGDSYSAIVKICIACLSGEISIIQNVPRSQFLLGIIEFATSIGVEIKWLNVRTISVNADWGNISNDLSKKDASDLKIYEIFVNIILAKKFSVKVSLAARKMLLRHKRLGFAIEYSDDNYYLVTTPLDFPLKRVNVNGRKRDFMTALNYSLIKNLYKEIYIDFENNYSPIRDLVSYTKGEKVDLIVDVNRPELNFYSTLALLTDGEVTIKNADLSKSLGFLLDLREIGLDYDVKNNTVRVWQEEKIQKDFYNYYTSEPDEIGYLLLIHSILAEKPIKIVAYNSPKHIEVIKSLNILGCKIDFSEVEEQLFISISPSALKSSRSFLDNNVTCGVILCSALVYDGNSILNNFETIDHILPDIFENLSSLKLKYTLS